MPQLPCKLRGLRQKLQLSSRGVIITNMGAAETLRDVASGCSSAELYACDLARTIRKAFARSEPSSIIEDTGILPVRRARTAFFTPTAYRAELGRTLIEGLEIATHRRGSTFKGKTVSLPTSHKESVIALHTARIGDEEPPLKNKIELETYGSWILGETALHASGVTLFDKHHLRRNSNNRYYLTYNRELSLGVPRFYAQFFACEALVGLSLCNFVEAAIQTGFDAQVGDERASNSIYAALAERVPIAQPLDESPLWQQHDNLLAASDRMFVFIKEHPTDTSLDVERWSFDTCAPH